MRPKIVLLPIGAVYLYRGEWQDWPALFAVIVIGSMATLLLFVAQRWRDYRAHNWPTVSATIDDFRLDEVRGRGGSGFFVTLQYVFHNPDIQVGEFCQDFGDLDEAQAWASSFKGCTVIVHVDPKDPQKSVLRKEDLDNAVSPEPKPATSN